jgi:hypothetical protein
MDYWVPLVVLMFQGQPDCRPSECQPKLTSFSPFEEVMNSQGLTRKFHDRRHFVGGSDARIIMRGDEAALIRLWQEKRGEAEPADFSDNLVVQLGAAT